MPTSPQGEEVAIVVAVAVAGAATATTALVGAGGVGGGVFVNFGIGDEDALGVRCKRWAGDKAISDWVMGEK